MQRQQLTLEPVDLAEWLPLVVEPFRLRAANRDLTLNLITPPQLPLVATNSFSLKRLVTELLNNACKYTPPQQHIVVTAQTIPPWVELRIQNSGSEISPGELSKIFDKFYRIPQSDHWQQGGTGLGLALVKTMIEHMGGTVQAHSYAGLTTFTLTLPIASLPHQSIARSNS